MKKIISTTLVLLIVIFLGFLTSCSNNSVENSTYESYQSDNLEVNILDENSTNESYQDDDSKTSIPDENNKESTPNSDKNEEIKMINVYCGNSKLEIELSDNASAKAFVEKLKENDVIVTMNDYGNFEKVGSLGFSIVQSNEYITTSPGDVILYLGSNITIYYDENSWNFTLLGKIKDMNREKMLAFFGGKGEVVVRFSLN